MTVGMPIHGEPSPPPPIRDERKFVPADTATLNEDKKDFIEKKLAQYEDRLKSVEKRIGFIAPEILSSFHEYYSELAKMSAAKLLLGGGSVSKDAVEAFVRNSAQEHWETVYGDRPEALADVLKSHEGIIKDAIYQGWGVVLAYNEGRTDVLRGSQPV